jgi:hypothetical protein
MINPLFYNEVKLLDAIVEAGKGDIEIRKDENDHSPIVYSKKAQRGIHLEYLVEVWPVDTIAENIIDLFNSAIEVENYTANLEHALDDLKGI